MEVPFEDLPPVAQERITALKKALAESRPVDKQNLIARFLERIGIRKQYPAFNFAGDSKAMDAWVIEQLRKDNGWVMDMADILTSEGLETRRAALEAQLCSSIGKRLPDDFEFSQNERAMSWARAYDSASSQAETFNAKLPGWIEKARGEWFDEHGSFRGLNRYTLLALTKKHVEDFDAWHDEQVAVSEFNVQWTDEVEAFWGMNVGTAEIECQILPETYSDIDRDTPVVCATFAGQWFPRDEAVALSYQHPNCPHHPAKSRVKEGTLPLFMGIGLRWYNREELPDC